MTKPKPAASKRTAKKPVRKAVPQATTTTKKRRGPKPIGSRPRAETAAEVRARNRGKKNDEQPKKPPKKRRKDGSATVDITPVAAAVVYDGASLDDWDDEELLRGRRKNKNGKFNGRPPLVIPAALHKELTRRRFSRAHDLLSDSLVDAAQMLRAVVNDVEVAPEARIHAAEVIFSRVLGRPRESIAVDFTSGPGVSGPAPWEQIVVQAIVGTVEQANESEEIVVEGEVVEGEE